jgi:pre-mRNA-splicing factor 18
MGVAIGNSPWPIGVTQVGLHERASREKISFKYASGSAHIMNDEATRKFIQALKRLMTFCQRRYPTDPSRSVDFDGRADQGHGLAGAGSDKVVRAPLRLLKPNNRTELHCAFFVVAGLACMPHQRPRRSPGSGGRRARTQAMLPPGCALTRARFTSSPQALLEAVARGDAVAPAPAPSHVDARGDVGIPAKWSHMLRDALQEVQASDAAEEAQQAEGQRAAAAPR